MSDRTIWKFALATIDEQVITMPAGAKVLTVQVQDGQPCLWALVRPNGAPQEHRFLTYGTGHTVETNYANHDNPYIGTYQLHGGALVFHVFEKLP